MNQNITKKSKKFDLIVLLVGMVVAGCGIVFWETKVMHKSWNDLISAFQSDKHIHVQVFITTKGGQNIELGGIPIEVMDEAAFRKNVEVWNDFIRKRKQTMLELKAAVENQVSVLNRLEKQNGS